MESTESFAVRVHQRTGIILTDIPEGTESDLLAGHIFCARNLDAGRQFVVGIGIPDTDEDGEVFHEFRVVTLPAVTL
jgi:hypothetical protein